MKKVLNYLGQLRFYSLVDLFVFAIALTRNNQYVWAIVLLWLSFILYLEAQHKDKYRLKVSHLAWIIAFVPTLFLLPIQIPILFGLFGILYTLKKKYPLFSATSPFWRGMQNFTIAYFLNPALALTAFSFIAIRNLIGDFRDAGDDKLGKMKTVPIFFGIKKNQSWAFYTHLLLVLLTTYTWFHYSYLDKAWLLPLMLLQIISYPLTPRSSNPNYLNLYRN